MPYGRDVLTEVSAAAAAHGLVIRGGFNFDAGDSSPPAPSGEAAKSVLLVGQAGAASWPHFVAWRKRQPADFTNPLDTWARETIGAVATQFGARAVSPSDRPFLPFQQWAMRAERLKPSPLGILMHPEYGLWHAYRGALLFDVEISIQAPAEQIHLCDLCAGKPCLKSCPADAYSERGFAHKSCLDHVRSQAGAACRDRGCLDRNVCPYGVAYRYPAEVQAFHMAAFMR